MPDAPETPKQRLERIEKRLGKEFADLLRASQKSIAPGYGIPFQGAPIIDAIGSFAELLTLLYLKAEEQTTKVINLTRWLKWLTVGLFLLTAALLAFTIHVEQDAKRNRQHDEAKQLSQTKPEIQLTVPY